MDDDLVAILLEENYLPKEALRRAVQKPDSVADPVLEVLAVAGDDPGALTDQDLNLIFWGVHALAAARDTRVFAPLLRAMRHGSDDLESLFGDALTQTLPRALASSFDGDVEKLHRFILDGSVDDFARNAALTALGFLTREGRLDRDATRSLLERFDDSRVAVAENPGWFVWEEVIAYLGMTELVPRVEAARREGRITDEFSDFAWFRRAIRLVTEGRHDSEEFERSGYGYLDDPVAALAWTAEDAHKPAKNPFKDVGRNDPCPCGSGSKYKKCCLAKEAAALPVKSPLPGLH